MYVAINKDRKVIGYHTDEDVVFEYVLKYNKCAEDDNALYKYVKDKKFDKYLKEHPDASNMYLLAYHSTYIPEKFIDSEMLCEGHYTYDLKTARDTIDTIMSCYDDLSDKDLKTLIKAYRLLGNIIIDIENYTPSYEQLIRNKNHITELMDYNNIYRYNLD